MSNHNLQHRYNKFYGFRTLANDQLIKILEDSPHFANDLEEYNFYYFFQALFQFADELIKDGYEKGRLDLEGQLEKMKEEYRAQAIK